MKRVEWTEKQKQYLKILNSGKKHILAFGGSRSGKTYATIEWIYRQCLKYPHMRVLIARQNFNHAKASLWMDTLQKVTQSYKQYYTNLWDKINESELYIKFVNGSELFIAGLDNAERMEKILGREFAIIYLNECSQISYSAIPIVTTRLSQYIPKFTNKLILDENPPSKTHWTYKLFIENIEPTTGEPLINPEEYISFQMNPLDNIQNLSQDYIKRLEALPERERQRFLLGEFIKIEGSIYESIPVIDYEQVPPLEYFIVGLDTTGNNLAALLLGQAGENIYILDEYTAYRMPITDFASTIYDMWGAYGYIAYADPAAGALNNYFHNMMPADNSVVAGIDYIRTKIEYNQIFMVKKNNKIKTPQLLEQLDSYRYDEKSRIVKEDDHLCVDGNTLITTPQGYKKISEIQVGDLVLTTDEQYHTVEKVIISDNKETYESTFSDKRKIISTPTHRFITPIGYIEQHQCILDNIPIYRRKECIRYITESSSGKQSQGIGLGSESQVKKVGQAECTPIYGQSIMEQSRMDMKSTIEMAIKTIINWITSSFSLLQNTMRDMSLQIYNWLGLKNGINKALRLSEYSGKNILKKLISSMLKLVKKAGKKDPSSSTSAQYVEESLNHTIESQSNIVQSSARMTVLEPDKHELIYITESKRVENRIVYSLQIEGCHTYYTNDIATKNCDALRYAAYSHVKYGASILRT